MANEKRLIDANALIHRVCAERDSIEINHACDVGYHNGLNMAVSMTINAPTVDTVGVVHGRWEETLVPDGYVQKASRLRKKCSVCGWTNACRYRYCPNCGAKMDGDGNG